MSLVSNGLNFFFFLGGEGGGLVPYISYGYIGICCPEGYGF